MKYTIHQGYCNPKTAKYHPPTEPVRHMKTHIKSIRQQICIIELNEPEMKSLLTILFTPVLCTKEDEIFRNNIICALKKRKEDLDFIHQ